jgi:hypothetical protein
MLRSASLGIIASMNGGGDVAADATTTLISHGPFQGDVADWLGGVLQWQADRG